jgi:hypothetical protein
LQDVDVACRVRVAPRVAAKQHHGDPVSAEQREDAVGEVDWSRRSGMWSHHR